MENHTEVTGQDGAFFVLLKEFIPRNTRRSLIPTAQLAGRVPRSAWAAQHVPGGHDRSRDQMTQVHGRGGGREGASLNGVWLHENKSVRGEAFSKFDKLHCELVLVHLSDC